MYKAFVYQKVGLRSPDIHLLKKVVKDRKIPRQVRSLAYYISFKELVKTNRRAAERLAKKFGQPKLFVAMNDHDINELLEDSSKDQNSYSYHQLLQFFAYDFPVGSRSKDAVNHLLKIQKDENHPRKVTSSYAAHLARLCYEHHKPIWKKFVALVDGSFKINGRNRLLRKDEKIEYLLSLRAYEDLEDRSVNLLKEGSLTSSEKNTVILTLLFSLLFSTLCFM